MNKSALAWIVVIIIFIALIALVFAFKIWIASSDLPFWVKFVLLRK